MKIAAVFALLLLAAPARAAGPEIIEGRALALDGDTLEVARPSGERVRVRLWGVDAPEMRVWPWGPLARGMLDKLLGRDGRVRCAPKERIRGRIVARCEAEAGHGMWFDLANPLIASGFAVEYRKFSRGAYRASEIKALCEGNGVWRQLREMKWFRLRSLCPER